jgi:hypothetical protein
MPVSKTAALEKRIVKLEQELAAYKRQLTQRAPGENASVREARLTIVGLRQAAREFLTAAEEHGLRWWVFHPEVAVTAQKLGDLVKATELAFPDPAQPPSKRTPQ